MKIQRLNLDSSWWMEWEGASFLLDPWLLGSEVDGFRWLNEQWHTQEPVALEQLPDYDFIVVSQSYSDHCHVETLQHLDHKQPIFATNRAYQRLQKSLGERDLVQIPENLNGLALSYQGLQFWAFHPGRKRDPIYYALLIANTAGEAIFIAPHGFTLNAKQLAKAKEFDCKLLMTTFSEFQLPNWMGGKVNPGLDNVYQLVEQLNPQHILNTHDEEKKMKGLVARLAKVTYPDYEALSQKTNFPFHHLADYQVLDLA